MIFSHYFNQDWTTVFGRKCGRSVLRRIRKTRKGAICQSQYRFTPESIELPLMEIANPRQPSTHTNVNVFLVLLHLHIEWPPQLHERKCILWNYTSNVLHLETKLADSTWSKTLWLAYFGSATIHLAILTWRSHLSGHPLWTMTCGDGIHLHRNIAILHLSKGPYKLRHCALNGG